MTALATILLLGLILRVDYAWEGRGPVYDAVAYERIAANLRAGEGFTLGERGTQPASNYSPGLPLLVAAVYELAGGPEERAARLVLALLGALAVLFAYLIGRRLSGPVAGLLGAAAAAVFPALLEYQGMLMGEPLAATLLSGGILAVLWADCPRDHAVGARVLSWGRGAALGLGFSRGREAAVRGADEGEKQDAALARHPSPTPPAREPASEHDTGQQGSPMRWLVPGLLLGALALVRPEYLGISVLLAVTVLARERSAWKGGLANAAIMLLGVALVVAPWTVRNAVALDRFVPVSTGGGQVLFASAYLPSGGDPERVGREVLERHPGLTRRLAAEHLSSRGAFAPAAGTHPPRRAVSGALVAAVLAEVRLEQILAGLAAQRHPELEADRALARMGRERLERAVTEEPLVYADFLAAKVARVWSPGPREVMSEPFWSAMHWALVGLGLLGLALLARRRRWEALLLATLLVAVTAVGALLVASPRRVLVAMPVVAALAGVGVCWLRASALPALRARRHG